MTAEQQKISRYLTEALSTERALTRELQTQIAMTPQGRLRRMLETHLRETRTHATRIEDRLDELGGGPGPVGAVTGRAQSLARQMLALGRAPLALLRGASGEEKLLKNAKDSCAGEALEIATYNAIERLAEDLGDPQTAELASAIRADEEHMLDRLLSEIPRLASAVAEAEFGNGGTYDVTTTGAADAVREVRDAASEVADGADRAVRRSARQARRVPGVARAERRVKGAMANQDDLAISGYDELNADEVVARLTGLSQVDLAKVESYERRGAARTTVLSRIAALQDDEPWPGYDDMTVQEVQQALGDADEDLAARVRGYERAHKDRAGVIGAAERRSVSA